MGGEPASTVMPDARPFAQQARALATVKFQVDSSGRVGRVDVVSTTNDAWARAVADAVRQWRYAPTICDGQPVAVEQELALPSR
jgi:TonB family protein